MAILLVTTVPRHERRLRLIFSTTLAAGAFSTTPYALTSLDAVGGDPSVVAAIAVSGTPNAVELALGVAMVEGGLYRLTCTAVPAADLSTFTGTQDFRTGAPSTPTPNREPAVSDAEVLLFGRDLLWTGTDFGETADGDLDHVDGLECYRRDMERRAFAAGLPYDPSYGADPRSYVDGPPQGAGTLRAALVQQALADDRTKAAEATFAQVVGDPASTVFDLVVTPVGFDDALTVKVPLGAAS